MNKPRVLIVDAFSGSRFFPEIAIDLGCEVYHLQSSSKLPSYYLNAFKSEGFAGSYIWEGESTLATLKNLEFSAVIAGAETGVQTADYVSEALRLRSNGTSASEARRDKFLMHERVSAEGLRVPKQIATREFSLGLEFVRTSLQYPVVLKPLRSAGTDSFYLAHDEEDFTKAFQLIDNHMNRLGELNVGVLIQEYIRGEEFAVNSVSAGGKHFITHIWHYHKTDASGSRVYDWEQYISPISPLGMEIARYVHGVLDALEIDFGAGHTEIMIDQDGPVLIESASRVDGMTNPESDNKILGTNQILATLISWLQPDKLSAHLDKNLKSKGFPANVSLISNTDSRTPIVKINVELLKALPSVVDVRMFIDIGATLVATRDIFSSPGFVYLFHEDKEQIGRDYRAIREFENSGKLYEFEVKK